MFKPDPKPEKQEKQLKPSKPKLRKRKCKNKHCGQVFQPVRPLQPVCSIKCAIEYNRNKKEKEKEKEWKARKKEGLEKLKSYAQKVQDARKIFQEWVRLRDRHLPCISCSTPPKDKTNYWDGGHYLKAELYSGLIFHEDNCHKQCKRCNNYDQGSGVDYRIGLIDRIGEKKVVHLETIKDENRQYSYSDDELNEIKKIYKEKIKKLKNQN